MMKCIYLISLFLMSAVVLSCNAKEQFPVLNSGLVNQEKIMNTTPKNGLEHIDSEADSEINEKWTGQTCTQEQIQKSKRDLINFDEYNDLLLPLINGFYLDPNDSETFGRFKNGFQKGVVPSLKTIVEKNEWYFLSCSPIEIIKNSNEKIISVGSNNILTTQKIFVKSAYFYNLENKEKKARFLLKTIVKNLYLTKFMSIFDLCTVNSHCDKNKFSNFEIILGTDTYNKIILPQTQHELGPEDDYHIKNVTNWLWSKIENNESKSIDTQSFLSLLLKEKFDKRFIALVDFDIEKYKKPLQQIVEYSKGVVPFISIFRPFGPLIDQLNFYFIEEDIEEFQKKFLAHSYCTFSSSISCQNSLGVFVDKQIYDRKNSDEKRKFLFHEIRFRMLANDFLISTTFKRMPAIPYKVSSSELLKKIDELIVFERRDLYKEDKEEFELTNKRDDADRQISKLEKELEQKEDVAIMTRLLYLQILSRHYDVQLQKLSQNNYVVGQKLKYELNNVSDLYLGVEELTWSPKQWVFSLTTEVQKMTDDLNKSFLNQISEQIQGGSHLLKFFFGHGKRWVFTNVNFNYLKQIERQDLLFFKSTGCSQQNRLEYLVNADAYAHLSQPEQSKFILREMVASYYLMKFYSGKEIFESIYKIKNANDYDSKIMTESQFKIMKIIPPSTEDFAPSELAKLQVPYTPETYRELNQDDYKKIDDMTQWLLQEKESLTPEKFKQKAIQLGFDTRVF